MDNDVQVLINLLDEFHAKPSPPGMEWAQDNWYNIQATVHRISTLQAGLTTKYNSKKSHTQVVNSLQDLVKSLQTQLEEQKTTVNVLQEDIKNEKAITRVLREELYARIMKEGKKETELESSKEIYPISDLKPLHDDLEKQVIALRPLIKTEYTYEGSDDDTPQITTKEIPYTATELAKLKKEYSRTPKESETEYVWRVSQEVIKFCYQKKKLRDFGELELF
ncbi:hypothetical protein WISP_01566 [Willisornis vidua]|uniref:Uncharacterized protein n=1 Tax=Willisornis vidua TaxID=1566151 RepID=A0ABQ9DUG3_9PASS|nr:hypothetical protein WISP_01566 [Willisornis vidua]